MHSNCSGKYGKIIIIFFKTDVSFEDFMFRLATAGINMF